VPRIYSERGIHMNEVIEIIYRLRNGQSQRLIHRETKIGRKTVKKYYELAKENGWLFSEVLMPTQEMIAEKLASREKTVTEQHQTSSLESYRSAIKGWLRLNYTRKRIRQLLLSNFEVTVSYDTVKRYCRYLDDSPAERAVLRLETAPGEIAQVDFGEVTKCYLKVPEGTRIYIFIMTLGASRHQYVEHVFDQKMHTWLRCHERAFEFFGGVVKKVVIDNLKAAVQEHIFRDTVLSVPYRKLAQHYGFIISPCRPYTPTHKGKVEKGVDYVKRGFCDGEIWTDLADMNIRIRRWTREVAGTRIHGTTKKRPIEDFREVEQNELKALPAQPLNYTTASRQKLSNDLHIQIEDNWYSAPYTYMDKYVDIYAEGLLVKIYCGTKIIATHARESGKGQRVTNLDHYPVQKRFWSEHPPEVCLVEAGKLGNSIFLLVDNLLSDKVQDHLSSVHKLLALEEKYGRDRLEKACERAIYYQEQSYICVKRILLAGTESDPVNEDQSKLIPLTREEHDLARDTQEIFPEAGAQ